ncbi:MAG: radical SAM protein [Humidesulfovibrio sp.]|nr:radical SAM protein [Humidesulfovibrio sp.]
MHQLAELKHKNHQLLTHEALHNIGRVESFPSLVSITALEECNYRCVMCTQEHRSTAQISATGLKQIELALPYADQVCITGGEPFLYEHIDQFFHLCHQGQCAPIVQTNGSLLKERQCRMLLKCGTSVVKVSCDGATPTTYNRIRRGGDFLNLIGNIKRLTALKTARGRRLPLLEFNFVAMRSNIEELTQLTYLASKIGVRAINVFLLSAETEDMARESLYFYPELADKEFLRAVEAGALHGVVVNIPPLFSEKPVFAQSASQTQRCTAPWRTMTVNVDGSVAICCGGAGVAGNLNTHSFTEVWNHPLRRKVRETVNTENELSCCRNCRQGRPVTDQIAAHIPDPELAQRTMAYFVRMAGGLPG